MITPERFAELQEARRVVLDSYREVDGAVFNAARIHAKLTGAHKGYYLPDFDKFEIELGKITVTWRQDSYESGIPDKYFTTSFPVEYLWTTDWQDELKADLEHKKVLQDQAEKENKRREIARLLAELGED